jgi:ribosomal protein S18 acetylase RimI-like enzyme
VSEWQAATASALPRLRLLRLEQKDRNDVRRVLESTGVFKPFEIDIALEIVDVYLESPGQDYFALGAFTQERSLVGYACYGPTPCTVGTWDLYWIAVSPDAQNAGVGTRLLQEVERRLARSDARLVIIETSSLPPYAATRAFYERRGYEVVARVPDFYTDGDDRLIYVKRIRSSESRRSRK